MTLIFYLYLLTFDLAHCLLYNNPMLKIVKVPNKVLSGATYAILKIDKKIRDLVYEMEETLIAQVDPQGVGLAAPQVGQSLRLFIIKPDPKDETEVFINPRIVEISPLRGQSGQLKSAQTDSNRPSAKEGPILTNSTKLEGCLSIPRIWGPVKRPNKIRLEYQDLTGTKHDEWFIGFKATIVAHEMDHLEGVLFTQRSLEQKTNLYEEKDGELEKVEY